MRVDIQLGRWGEMRKTIGCAVCLLSAAFVLCLLNPTVNLCYAADNPTVAAADESSTIEISSSNSAQTGIILDCARRYYSVHAIERYIDLLAEHPHAFLQLHLTDDENVGIECALLGQTAKTAKKLADGSYLNPQTGKRFLTKAQVKKIHRYAKNRDVQIVPEIDTPGHMGGFFTLARLKKGSTYVAKLTAEGFDDGLDLTGAQGRSFAKRLYREYAALFKGCAYFHMGGDEYDAASPSKTASYINVMARYLQGKGFTVRIWNDLLLKKNIARIDHRIQVTYWSIDGDAEDSHIAAARRKTRASAADLQRAGFDILNCNSYYLYFTPSKASCTKANRRYAIDDLKGNWSLRAWDGDSGRMLASDEHLVGAAIGIWSEDSAGVSKSTIYRQTTALYEAMLSALATPRTAGAGD